MLCSCRNHRFLIKTLFRKKVPILVHIQLRSLIQVDQNQHSKSESYLRCSRTAAHALFVLLLLLHAYVLLAPRARRELWPAVRSLGRREVCNESGQGHQVGAVALSNDEVISKSWTYVSIEPPMFAGTRRSGPRPIYRLTCLATASCYSLRLLVRDATVAGQVCNRRPSFLPSEQAHNLWASWLWNTQQASGYPR